MTVRPTSASEMRPLSTDRRHRPPPVSDRLVPRPRVMSLLDETKDASVVCVQAPGGYGKTTALAQWVLCDARPSIWLTVRPAAPDAHWLAQELLDALAESGLLRERVVLGSSANPVSWHLDTLPVIEDLVSGISEPFVVVIDEAGAITGSRWECLVESIATNLPVGAQLVLATRDPVPATLWRMQSRGQVSMVGPDLLTFDEAETAQALGTVGVRPSPRRMRELAEATQGWPVAVCLGGLAMRSTPGAPRPLSDSGGLREYLLSDIVGRLDPDDAAFLSRVSVLATFDAESCDAVAGTTNSLHRLRGLTTVGHLIAAQNETDDRYRMHPLLAEVLEREFHERDPSAWRGAHAAASLIAERDDDLDGAVHHAKLAGDDHRLSVLIWSRTAPLLGTGQSAVLQRWLDGIAESRVAEHCGLALASAWVASHAGDMPRMNRLTLVARVSATSREPEWLLDVGLLSAAIGADGMDEVEAASRRFIANKRRDDAWHTVAQYLLGMALLMRAQPDEGMAALTEGRRLAIAFKVPVMQAHCLAGMADAALAEGDQRQAMSWIREARELCTRYQIDRIVTAGPIFTTSALGYVVEGRFVDARREATRALRLTALMRNVAPWHGVAGRLALAQVNVALGDPERARILLDEAHDARAYTTVSPRLESMYADINARVSEASAGLAGASSLTIAEVRVLQYLPTHLSFPEIADELCVSRHTVKSQALAAYRKLDAHTRTDAIDRARQAGLLPRPFSSQSTGVAARRGQAAGM